MKSLQESLFDKDLVEKGVSVDFETLCDMLFDFLDKQKSVIKNSSLSVWKGRQSIYIRYYIHRHSIYFELDFGVTNFYNEDRKLVPGFNIPQFKLINEDLRWRHSGSDVNATIRQIIKKIPDLKQYIFGYGSVIKATEESIPMIFKLYEGMITHFCTLKFEKNIGKYVDRYEASKEIPGLIMDLLMKNLIEEA